MKSEIERLVIRFYWRQIYFYDAGRLIWGTRTFLGSNHSVQEITSNRPFEFLYRIILKIMSSVVSAGYVKNCFSRILKSFSEHDLQAACYSFLSRQTFPFIHQIYNSYCVSINGCFEATRSIKRRTSFEDTTCLSYNRVCSVLFTQLIIYIYIHTLQL